MRYPPWYIDIFIINLFEKITIPQADKMITKTDTTSKNGHVKTIALNNSDM